MEFESFSLESSCSLMVHRRVDAGSAEFAGRPLTSTGACEPLETAETKALTNPHIHMALDGCCRWCPPTTPPEIRFEVHPPLRCGLASCNVHQNMLTSTCVSIAALSFSRLSDIASGACKGLRTPVVTRLHTNFLSGPHIRAMC